MVLQSFTGQRTSTEYLAIERAAEAKSELVDGVMVAMTGASRAHSLIATNLLRELATQLRSRPCEVHGGDLRVRAGDGSLYAYPDVSVVCGEPVFEDAQLDTLINPTVLVEILSPSTEAFDRGEKFGRYRALAALRDYVLVAQDRPRIEVFARDGERWALTEHAGLDAVAELTSIGAVVALADVYAKVPLANP